MRSAKLSLVLRQLRDQGPRSRATLAAELGLTRSAASALVAELVELGLVRPAGLSRGGMGRPGTTVELDGAAVCGIGAEINAGHVATIALDLAGAVVAEHRVPLDVSRSSVDEVLDRTAELVARTDADVAVAGAATVGLTVGVAGLLDRPREVLTLGPNLRWRDVAVGTELRGRLAAAYPVAIENEGNLAALAEAVPGDPDRRDVLVLFGESGVGGGIVADGRLLRGHQGYAGEFGHMIVEPGGRRCGCGRIGCWETVTGLRALLDAAADPDDPLRDPALPLEERLAEVNRRADLGDTRTLAALDRVAGWVGVGAAILANALNPGVIVLGGYFAEVGDRLRPAIEEHLLAGVPAPQAGGARVELSTLGFAAARRGGALAALDAVFDDPTTVAAPRRAALAGGAT
ncbi:ROK family transcriptional regulator [Nocardioides sp. YIM 152315]|uniref:ROK family transcriptional regulator n=1 Tax=Nocardioides sp. YIM 152315 TaxID=3031760 RepID=UPI0023D9E168|nr:ROK family transcriptional regulator [Nocardioides sp. YIM 152315]MDF1605696.1 ROK family transcriptional regulator [Nocardioides sp. YIM 152315]